MVLDPIPQSLPVHFFGSRPQPPTSRKGPGWCHNYSDACSSPPWRILYFLFGIYFGASECPNAEEGRDLCHMYFDALYSQSLRNFRSRRILQKRCVTQSICFCVDVDAHSLGGHFCIWVYIQKYRCVWMQNSIWSCVLMLTFIWMHDCVKMESAQKFVIINSMCVLMLTYTVSPSNRERRNIPGKNSTYSILCVLILTYTVSPSNRERKNSRCIILCVC